ncbi:hypothetical protein SUGI_0582150 [Cryptomeria japonica]|nr:hypothetical protein SUGI_0582150 [Cryptomeria japonica]
MIILLSHISRLFSTFAWFILCDVSRLRTIFHNNVMSNRNFRFDRVDLAKFLQHKIMVGNTPNLLIDDVVDLAMAIMLDALHQISTSDYYVHQSMWKSKGEYNFTCTLSRKCVGIVVLGCIGSMITKRIEAFDSRIAYYSKV